MKNLFAIVVGLWLGSFTFTHAQSVKEKFWTDDFIVNNPFNEVDRTG